MIEYQVKWGFGKHGVCGAYPSLCISREVILGSKKNEIQSSLSYRCLTRELKVSAGKCAVFWLTVSMHLCPFLLPTNICFIPLQITLFEQYHETIQSYHHTNGSSCTCVYVYTNDMLFITYPFCLQSMKRNGNIYHTRSGLKKMTPINALLKFVMS